MIRNYSSTAVPSKLSASCSAGATTLTVDSTVGLPTPPFFVAIDRATDVEEVVLVTAVAGDQLTVTRAQDGTPAFAHDADAEVLHVVAATDLREANQHTNAVSGVHGLEAGDEVVGEAALTAAMAEAVAASMLVGEIRAYAGSSAPSKWLLCQGQVLSRSTYSSLFGVIGTTYGAGDGSTTFALPDATGRFLRHVGGTDINNANGGLLGATGGVDNVTLSVDQLPVHDHAIDHDHASFSTSSGGGEHDHSIRVSGTEGSNDSQVAQGGNLKDTLFAPIPDTGGHAHDINVPAFTGTSSQVGAGDPVQGLPPYLNINYIIYAGV